MGLKQFGQTLKQAFSQAANDMFNAKDGVRIDRAFLEAQAKEAVSTFFAPITAPYKYCRDRLFPKK